MNEHEFNKTEFEGWEHEDISDQNARLYWKPFGDGNGFKFSSFQVIGTEGLTDYPFDQEGTLVETLLHGEAAFDGVRHLFCGDYGYLHCQSKQVLIDILRKLQELEKQFCSVPLH